MKKNQNPIIYVILGAILFLLGTFLPNGIELFNYAEFIGIYNLLVTIAQGGGIGLMIGGLGILIKNGLAKKEP